MIYCGNYEMYLQALYIYIFTYKHMYIFCYDYIHILFNKV